MDLSKHFVLLNGEPKTLQIDTIQKNGNTGYSVRFKNNGRTYNYAYSKVTWLSTPEWKDPTQCKVYINGTLTQNIREIWRFGNNEHSYWRIIFNNNFVLDDASGKITVAQSCLQETAAKDVLTYMKNVATINPLGRDEQNHEGTLSQIYNSVDFIDKETAAACYLNPANNKPKKRCHADLVFPFGCNTSQKIAVANAFEHQISVIQGPPGTGKTQTILNIIANIIRQGKTVIVVSNNNSATANVFEKLEKYGIGFIAASLGNKDNKTAFIANQPIIPTDLNTWGLELTTYFKVRQHLHTTSQHLDKVYELQNERALLLQEQQTIGLEWKHFCKNNGIDENIELENHINSKRILSIWLSCQIWTDDKYVKYTHGIGKLKEQIKWWWMKWTCTNRLHIQNKIDKNNLAPLILELQTLYYKNKILEIEQRIETINQEMALYDAKTLTNSLVKDSMTLLKSSLYDHYKDRERVVFTDTKDMKRQGVMMKNEYPVILSTTMSARSCVFADEPYDYIIMDEALQVSSETGTLALTCAKNAVIVGDTKQLPNVETEEDRKKLQIIAKPYNISDGYDCSKYSFLESILKVIPDITETMLREHYRCHPRIINFCNQKFYGGNLLIMTEDKGEENVLTAIRTVKGNHAINHLNQREIDVVKNELLPTLKDCSSIGIVTPYNNQVDAFRQQLNDIKIGTIHKYQGREEDTIIMSVVDNQISEFADDAKMLNVAVSRAQKHFCLVMTGNEQAKHRNIMDLLDYIAYNNCTVTESKLASIFDYLYDQYTEQRINFLKNHPQISDYASENLTYSLICEVLASNPDYSCMKVLCHIPLRQVIKNTSLMSAEELKYAANYNTHLDFLIINRIGKQPVLAIETDGYSYHNEKTIQHHRDIMKDHILSKYGLHLLRLSTKGSGEREKIVTALNKIDNIQSSKRC